MSDLIAAAATALGIPEDLARRSAEARAAETGARADDILAAWSGGAPAPAAAAPAAADTATAEPAPAADEEAPTAPTLEIPVPAAAEPASAAPAGPYKPPVLVGVKDNPVSVLIGAIGLFLVVVLIGLIGPASLADEPGNRTSEIAFTQAALDGQEIYASLGCVSCHTQMVRPIVSDVGLGDVTLNDSNQILGTRRFGPDLSDVGTRMTSGQIQAVIGGFGDHPAHSLSQRDMAAVVAYLSQSQTSGEDE